MFKISYKELNNNNFANKHFVFANSGFNWKEPF